MAGFLGSEYRKISNYLDSNSSGPKKIQPEKKPVKDVITPDHVFIPYRKWFNLDGVDDNILHGYLKSCIESEIIEDLKYSKAFYTCDDVCNCPKKLFYHNANYKVESQHLYNNVYLEQLLFQNNRKILLELLNFESGSFVVEDELNQIKSIIYGLFNNTMYDFTNSINFEITKLIGQLKCYILRLSNPLISEISLFVFNEHISDIKVYTFKFDQGICDKLISTFEYNKKTINENNIPDEDKRFCYNCLYKLLCNKAIVQPKISQEKNTDDSIEILDEYKDKKKNHDIKNIFLL